MTTLDVYAAFLTATWNELEEVTQVFGDFPETRATWTYMVDDLASKRAILQEVIDSEDPATWVLMLLAAPFRDHPDHPASADA